MQEEHRSGSRRVRRALRPSGVDGRGLVVCICTRPRTAMCDGFGLNKYRRSSLGLTHSDAA